MLKILLFFCLQCPLWATATNPYNSKILKTKDYEDMRDILKQFIEKSRNHLSEDKDMGESLAVLELRQGLRVLLMRPNRDSVQANLMALLQNEIVKYRSFMSVLQEEVQSAIVKFPSEKESIAQQASLLYLMENAISYLKSINNQESRAILENIKQAKLKISGELQSYLLLDMGRGKTSSPSTSAGQVLIAHKKALQEEQALKRRQRQPSSKEKSKSSVDINLDKPDK